VAGFRVSRSSSDRFLALSPAERDGVVEPQASEQGCVGVRDRGMARRYNRGMGKNNRERRAAKARKRSRERRQHQGPAGFGSPGSGWVPSVGDQFVAAAYAARAGDEATVRLAVELLADGRPVAVASEIAKLLEQQLAYCWEHGWQPTDLDRAAGRDLGNVEAGLLRWAIASEAAGYEQFGARVAPAWMAQLERIGATRAWEDRCRPYLLQLGVAWPDVLAGAVRVMGFLFGLPVIERLADLPSRWREGAAVAPGSLPASVLERVRGLLAKAESTTFEAEAEAFTAKAQELMARHRIDQAVIAARDEGPTDEPVGRRVGLDDPYAEAKAALLATIADANGCRAVWSKNMGFSTLFGFGSDLDAVEELFTSLLVQASAALRREGSKHDRAGRSRTTRFRRSFLVAFATRIGQRLRQAVDATVYAVSDETSTALMPILASRDEAVQAAAEAAFPEAGAFSPAASDGEGWYAGTLFGDQADLALGPGLAQRSA
jgi:hypothetical protein